MTPRSTVIERSIWCFDSALLSLAPVVGIFFAGWAFVHFHRVVVNTNDRWNPARRHLYVGLAIALLSLLAHLVAGAVMFALLLRHIADG